MTHYTVYNSNTVSIIDFAGTDYTLWLLSPN